MRLAFKPSIHPSSHLLAIGIGVQAYTYGEHSSKLACAILSAFAGQMHPSKTILR
jgi:hypothetical protein